MRSRTKILCVVAFAAMALLPEPGAGSAATPRKFVNGWVPAWASSAVTNGSANLAANASIISDVMPFAFSATGTTSLVPSGSQTDLNRAVTNARDAGLTVVPSITDGTGKGVMAAILDNPTTRSQHADTIVALVQSRGYDGIDLDYEGFAFSDGRSSWGNTRPDWVAFVQELAGKLDANGKLLSITVPPIWTTSAGAPGYTVYDPLTILPWIDDLRLMVYDWSVSAPGPIAPMSWVNDVIATFVAGTSADQLSKIQLGVPTYGRNWATVTSGTCPLSAGLTTTSVLMRNANTLAAANGATPVRHSSGELTFSWNQSFVGDRPSSTPLPVYVPPGSTSSAVAPIDLGTLKSAARLDTVTCTVRRTVYYPDAQAVVDRAVAARRAGVGGLAIWALGYESTELWPMLRFVAPPG